MNTKSANRSGAIPIGMYPPVESSGLDGPRIILPWGALCCQEDEPKQASSHHMRLRGLTTTPGIPNRNVNEEFPHQGSILHPLPCRKEISPPLSLWMPMRIDRMNPWLCESLRGYTPQVCSCVPSGRVKMARWPADHHPLRRPVILDHLT